MAAASSPDAFTLHDPAAGSPNQGQQVARVLARPSMQELPRVHQELGLWMAHTKYQTQPVDRLPIWRVQNTSITISTGAGVGAFFAAKRFRPGLKFPLDIIPPFVIFYFTHQAMQVWQMPGLWDSFLNLSSPLGCKAREILENLRNNGPLPSQEFGTSLPRPAGAAAGGGATGSSGVAGTPSQRAAPPLAPPAVPPKPPAGEQAVQPDAWGTDSASSPASPPAWDAASPAAPAWGGGAGDPWASPSDFAGEGGSQTEAAKPRQPPQRRTWDEIRAANAAKQQQQ